MLTRTRNADAAAAREQTTDRYERLYNMLLASIPSSVLLVNQHLRVVSANGNFLHKARLAESAVIGEPLERVFPAVIYHGMNLGPRLADILRGGPALKGEQMLYRAPGLPTRHYYYSLIPVVWHGEVEHVMLLMDDVTDKVRLGTEARDAQRHLASVVESASDLVVSMDVAGRVLTWNTAAERTTGFPENEVRQRHLGDLCNQAERMTLATILEQVVSRGRMEPVEVALISRNATAIPISWVFSPMRNAGGQTTGLVAVGRDLTERRKFEAQLLQSEKLAALGVMAGGIAHEIRNPLAVVSSAAQLLLEKPLTLEFQRECAEKIHRGVQRAASIIESLLRFARPAKSGRMQRVDFVRVIEDSIAVVANQLKLGNVALRREYPDRAVAVWGSPDLLRQLIANLMLNSVNAMPEKGGEICICLHEEAEDLVVLRVVDTGKGIRAADIGNVFDPFFTTMPIGEGTGLGLSICYAIVQQHKGRITLTSEEGKGTTVSVFLPRREVKNADEAERNEPADTRRR